MAPVEVRVHAHRRLIVLAFGVVQLVLLARIAQDLGYLPDVIPADLITTWSGSFAL